MAWQTPKTNWTTNPTNPSPTDFNRIEGNIDFLKADIETKKGLIVQAINEMNQSASLDDLYATLYNKIKAISTDADAGVNHVLQGKTFYQGGTKKTGTMPNKAGTIQNSGGYSNGAANASDFQWDSTIPAIGYYDTASKLHHKLTNLIADNLRRGITIPELGLTGLLRPNVPFTIVASDTVVVSLSDATINSSTPVQAGNAFKCTNLSGNLRITFTISASYGTDGEDNYYGLTTYGAVYKNGIQVGITRSVTITSGFNELATFTEDFACDIDDVFAVYIWQTNNPGFGATSGVRNKAIKGTVTIPAYYSIL